jgi:hypothetical protein
MVSKYVRYVLDFLGEHTLMQYPLEGGTFGTFKASMFGTFEAGIFVNLKWNMPNIPNIPFVNLYIF